MNVTVADGKYTVVVPEHPNEHLRALRYGEPWRDCVGDNLIYFLAVELDEARKQIESLKQDNQMRDDAAFNRSGL